MKTISIRLPYFDTFPPTRFRDLHLMIFPNHAYKKYYDYNTS